MKKVFYLSWSEPFHTSSMELSLYLTHVSYFFKIYLYTVLFSNDRHGTWRMAARDAVAIAELATSSERWHGLQGLQIGPASECQRKLRLEENLWLANSLESAH